MTKDREESEKNKYMQDTESLKYLRRWINIDTCITI